MIRFFAQELRRVVLSRKFALSASLLLAAFIIAFGRDYRAAKLAVYGGLNAFCYVLVDSKILWFIYPLIVPLAAAFSLCDDLNTGYMRALSVRLPIARCVAVKGMVGFISGFLCFMIAGACFLLIACLICPFDAIKIYQHFGGYPQRLYDRSIRLFCLVFLMHQSLFSGAMSMLGSAMAGLSRKRYMGLVFPIAFNYILMFIGWCFAERRLVEAANRFIPAYAFRFASKSIQETIYDFVLLVIIAAGIYVVTLKQWQSTASSPEVK